MNRTLDVAVASGTSHADQPRVGTLLRLMRGKASCILSSEYTEGNQLRSYSLNAHALGVGWWGSARRKEATRPGASRWEMRLRRGLSSQQHDGCGDIWGGHRAPC